MTHLACLLEARNDSLPYSFQKCLIYNCFDHYTFILKELLIFYNHDNRTVVLTIL